ncbi:MAG: hypothetical protein R2854_12000 [Caldilineaceae bacterium]
MLRRLLGSEEELTQDEAKLEASLQKTRSTFFDRIGAIFQAGDITDDLWDELEEALIGRRGYGDHHETGGSHKPAERGVRTTNDAYLILKQEMVKLLQSDEPLHIDEARSAHSGAGGGRQRLGAKTTTISKMANWYKGRGRKWCSGAADTFALRPSTSPGCPGASAPAWT